ncbi:MAG: 1,2-dihydroxy-3-keto-5-methylthiopentene dioxygenase [Methylobacter sp.]
MSALSIYPEHQANHGETVVEFDAIQNRLNAIGVQFERWTASCKLAADADQNTVLAAYSDSIARLQQQYGFQSVDVISLSADHPDKAAIRQKFLSEHIHADFEVRFFIEGRGLFYLHVEDKVYAVLCEQGDLISVPANTTHWFDMGENPQLKCIRLFTTPDGWVANFTGSDIAQTFPTLDQYVAALS